jgi:hypothetical protein
VPGERVDFLYAHIAKDYRGFDRIEREVDTGEHSGLSNAVEARYDVGAFIAYPYAHHRRVLSTPQEV